MKQTQGERLAVALNACPHTYLEMNMLGVSVSPHKRLLEWAERNPKWRIVKSKRYLGEGRYATTWAVRPALKPDRPDALWRPKMSA